MTPSSSRQAGLRAQVGHTPSTEERAQGAKLDPGEMETEMKTGAVTRTQDRRGRDRNGGKVKDGDRAGPTQGPKWTQLRHRVGGGGQREAQVSTEPSWEGVAGSGGRALPGGLT